MVGYADANLPALDANVDVHRRRRRRVLRRVGHQIGQHLFDANRVGVDRWDGLMNQKRNEALRALRLLLLDDRSRDPVELHALSLQRQPPGLDSRRIGQVVDETAQ